MFSLAPRIDNPASVVFVQYQVQIVFISADGHDDALEASLLFPDLLLHRETRNDPRRAANLLIPCDLVSRRPLMPRSHLVMLRSSRNSYLWRRFTDVQAFDGLAGDLGDEVEVLIKVQHHKPVR